MKTLTPAAQAAKSIRQELKKAFPDVKFRVRSSNFSMGDAVDIYWTNGPTYDQVTDITDKYQYGQFDGMTDSYDYTNRRNDIPQAKYVHENRTVTDDVYLQCFNALKGYFAPFDDIVSLDDYHRDLSGTARHYMYRIVSKIDLRQPLTKEIVRENF